MAEHNQLGNIGEVKARGYLEAKGYEILAANWRYKHKEIDLIAEKNNILVIVEVKTRTKGGFRAAVESVSVSKMRYLVEAAEAYVEEYKYKGELVFDLLAVFLEDGIWKIEHVEEAFNSMDI